jgi:8-oxo-dGTP diphosphatase
MTRTVRYQGAILRDHHILLIRHREHASGRGYWVLPGGGRLSGEREKACVKREMREETGCEVAVEHLLLDERGHPMGVYKRLKTYLCRIVSGIPAPGYELEAEAAREYAIVEVRWFDLRDPAGWEAGLKDDPFTYPLLLRIRLALGYQQVKP